MRRALLAGVVSVALAACEEPPHRRSAAAQALEGAAVPGELIVSYAADVPLCVHCLVHGGQALDGFHEQCGVRSAKPLFRSEQEEAAVGAGGPVTAVALRELHRRKHELTARRFPERARRAAAEDATVEASQTYLVELDPAIDLDQAIAALKKSPLVRFVQPNYRLGRDAVPNDPLYTSQWSHQRTHAEQGWSLQTDGSGAVIAVMGEGIEPTHPDLTANLWVNAGEIAGNGLDDDSNGFIDDVNGWDFADDDGNPAPTDPHETGVAGVIGARGNNAAGIAGVAWQARLMSIRFGYTTAQFIEALQYVVANGADVVNMSFSNTDPMKYGSPAARQAVELAVGQGVLLVSSAGNNNTSTAPYPAAFDEVLSVGSTDINEARAPTSNWGGWVDVAAPGQGVMTTRQGTYASQNGTSFSAPYVAGVAGLLLTRDPTLSLSELRIRLQYGTDAIVTDHPIGGRINVQKALSMTGHPTVASFDGLEDGDAVPAQAVVPLRGTALGGSYVLEVRPSGATGWTLLYAGFEVLQGPLGELDVSLLSVGTSRLELRLTSMSGSSSAAATVALLVAGSSGAPAGWPAPVGFGVSTGVTVAAIDGAGGRGLFFGRQGLVQGLGPDGGSLPGWPARIGETVMSTPAVGDIGGDALPEVVVASTVGAATSPLMFALHLDGGIAEGWPVGMSPGRGGVVLVNLDGDPALEIAGATNDGQVFVLNGDGTALPGWPRPLGSPNVQGPPAVGDLDGDGHVELVFHSFTATVVLRADGTEVRRWSKAGSGHELILFDADRDGRLEIAEATTAGFFVRSATGYIITSQSRECSACLLAAADVGPPAGVELIVSADRGFTAQASELLVWSVTGKRMLPGWPRGLRDQHLTGAAIGDLDGDCSPEIVIGGEGLLYAFLPDAGVAAGFPKVAGVTEPSAPAIADVDGDGALDVVATDIEKLYRWSFPAATELEAVPWPTLRVDASNSGRGPAPVSCRNAKRTTGDWCGGGSECLSGNCVESVCCESSCSGSCFSCGDPSNPGRCTLVVSKLSTDPTCPVFACTVEVPCSGSSCGRVVAPDGHPCGEKARCMGGRCIEPVPDAGMPMMMPMPMPMPRPTPPGPLSRGCACGSAEASLLVLVWPLVARRRRRARGGPR